MLSLKEVQHIAALARLEVSEEELAQFQEELTSILEYFGIISELDVSNIEPMTHAVPLQNATRRDMSRPKDANAAKLLLHGAPATEKGYLKVKSVL